MAIPLDPEQVVSSKELLMSQVVQQEALTSLLIEKGYSPRRCEGMSSRQLKEIVKFKKSDKSDERDPLEFISLPLV